MSTLPEKIGVVIQSATIIFLIYRVARLQMKNVELRCDNEEMVRKIQLNYSTFNLNDLRDLSLDIATRHGFTDATSLEDFALMHTEVAEATEDIRNGKGPNEVWYEDKKPVPKPCGVPSEIADVIIRGLHYCGKHKIDIAKAVREKMAYNDSRPYKHGGKTI